MTSICLHTQIAERCKHLAGLGKLPPPALQAPALRAIALLALVTERPIRHSLMPASTRTALAIPGYTGSDSLADDFLAKLVDDIAAPASGSSRTFSPSGWVQAHGLEDLILCSAAATADDAGRHALLAYAGHAAQRLVELSGKLRDRHMRDLLARDAPEAGGGWNWATTDSKTLAWLLAHEHDGDPSRQERVKRRLQALRLYSSLRDSLRTPAITRVIDSGAELVPALSEQLLLTRGELKALRKAAPADGLWNWSRRMERWLRNFEQGVKWKLGLTAGMFCLRIRSEDEEASPPEPHTGLQGEGGPCCPEKRSNDCTAC